MYSRMNAGRCLLIAVATALGFVAAAAAPAGAQWSTTYEQFYMPGSFNWAFRDSYPAADRLFNAFDYGHAILYEKLYTRPGAPVSLLEQQEYDFITKKLLTNPPHVPLEESAIEVAYAKLAPEAKAMFDWAHLLHRQIYDVWSDERLAPPEKDVEVAALIRYYKTRPDLAFSSVPKSMELMEGQYYSTAFRQNYPKFNGLIWAYHWLQVGLYEPLVTGKTQAARQTGIVAAVARFRQMLENPPNGMPSIMPMTAAVSPMFAARYPEAAIIFDNLHSMHDVVSDILASPKVPPAKKREEILRAASRYRDRTSFAMTPDEWREMAQMMGIQNMGGPAVGFLPELPTATVARGSTSMTNMGGMSGMSHGAAAARAEVVAPMAGMDHSTMNMPASAAAAPDSMPGMKMSAPGMKGMNMSSADSSMQSMMDLHMRMMADPVIRSRMMADPVIRSRMMADPEMRRIMTNMMNGMPPEHRAMMQRMTSRPSGSASSSRSAAASRSSSKSTATKKKATVKKTTAKKPAKKDPMADMDHSKMKM